MSKRNCYDLSARLKVLSTQRGLKLEAWKRLMHAWLSETSRSNDEAQSGKSIHQSIIISQWVTKQPTNSPIDPSRQPSINISVHQWFNQATNSPSGKRTFSCDALHQLRPPGRVLSEASKRDSVRCVRIFKLCTWMDWGPDGCHLQNAEGDDTPHHVKDVPPGAAIHVVGFGKAHWCSTSLRRLAVRDIRNLAYVFFWDAWLPLPSGNSSGNAWRIKKMNWFQSGWRLWYLEPAPRRAFPLVQV